MRAQPQQLLDVRTAPGCMEKMSMVRVLSDGVLIDTPTNEHGHVFALSVAGPEEAVRCLQAGCVMVNKDGQRGCRLDILGGGYLLRGVSWAGNWDSRAIRLPDGPMHLVAWCTTYQPSKDRKHPVVYPASNDSADVDTAIYTALLNHYTTPLIPTGIVGQPDEESVIGRRWRSVVCANITQNANWWRRLRPHPGEDALALPFAWEGAGVLQIEQTELDALVSRLVKSKAIAIPGAKNKALEAVIA